MKHLLLSTCLFIAACGTAAAPERVDNFDDAAMDALLSGAVDRGEAVGVSALVYDEGQIVYRGVYGLGDRERGVAVENDTIWRIYSMTKPVTSAVIMDLVEDGKLSLDDPASKYIPELGQMKVASMGSEGQLVFADQTNPMTIEDLLLHRSGLAYGIFGGMNPVDALYDTAGILSPTDDMETKMQKLATLPLVAQPGEAWYYSLSIDALGRIAEVVEGKSLGEIFDERFFTPLGMTDTGFSVAKGSEDRFVSNYALTPEGQFVLFEDGQTSDFLAGSSAKWQSGGGGLVSTLDDYAKFAQMMLQGGEYEGRRYLDATTVRTMMTDHLGDTPSLFPWLGAESGTGAGFGYGGSVQLTASQQQQTNKGRYPGQWGWGGAARTNMFIDPANDSFGIIMLQYFGGEGDPKLHDDFQALVLAETRNDASQ